MVRRVPTANIAGIYMAFGLKYGGGSLHFYRRILRRKSNSRYLTELGALDLRHDSELIENKYRTAKKTYDWTFSAKITHLSRQQLTLITSYKVLETVLARLKLTVPVHEHMYATFWKYRFRGGH